MCALSRPLLLSAFLVGLSASVYWTFGPDALQSAQGATMVRILFVVAGISSIGGAFANQILRRLGTANASRLCVTLLTCSLALGLTLAGIVIDRTGISVAFGLAAGIMALNLIMAPPRTLRSAPLASRPT